VHSSVSTAPGPLAPVLRAEGLDSAYPDPTDLRDTPTAKLNSADDGSQLQEGSCNESYRHDAAVAAPKSLENLSDVIREISSMKKLLHRSVSGQVYDMAMT
jgi:hypothetical protein